MSRLREELAVRAGYRHLIGIVSPMNPYSLASHLANGLRVEEPLGSGRSVKIARA